MTRLIYTHIHYIKIIKKHYIKIIKKEKEKEKEIKLGGAMVPPTAIDYIKVECVFVKCIISRIKFTFPRIRTGIVEDQVMLFGIS